ncbi:MAG TPA: hypothetical protein VIK78_22490 [Ruminiclostridium sp.]
MKHIISIILAILIGGFTGFFGVFVSVFSDGTLSERLITISIILLIYGVLSGLYGLLQQKYSWQWGLLLGSPGVLFLGMYMLHEFNLYYFIYMILIISISCFGAWSGNYIRKRKNK